MQTIILVITAILTIIILWGFSPLIFAKGMKEDAELNWQSNDDEIAIKMLAEDISRAKQRIYIVGGVASSKIYGAPQVRKVIENIDRGKIIFETIFGPLDRDEDGKNPMEDYANEGFLDLTVLSHRPGEHFRVIDDDYVYLEKPHGDRPATRYYKRTFNNRSVGLYFEIEFRRLLKRYTKAIN